MDSQMETGWGGWEVGFYRGKITKRELSPAGGEI